MGKLVPNRGSSNRITTKQQPSQTIKEFIEWEENDFLCSATVQMPPCSPTFQLHLIKLAVAYTRSVVWFSEETYGRFASATFSLMSDYHSNFVIWAQGWSDISCHNYYPPEMRRVLGVGSIPVTILTSCQDMKTNELQLHKNENSWAVKIRNTYGLVNKNRSTYIDLVVGGSLSVFFFFFS